MVFSLFGRKEKTEARRVRGGLAARAPDTTPSIAEQRELARRTAEKIDQIESEMIDAPVASLRAEPTTRPMSRPAGIPPAPLSPAGPVPPVAAATPGLEPVRRSEEREPLEFGTSMVLGHGHGHGPGFGGIQVNASSLPGDLEEAAILYANGQSQPAAATLRAAIARGQPDGHGRQAWAMLFDVLQASGAKVEFEVAALEYAARFEKSPPAWQDDQPGPAAGRRAVAPTTIAFPAALDASASRQVEMIQRASAGKRPVTIDLGAVVKLDAAGAAMVVAAVSAFEKAGRELHVTGARRLLDAARVRIEPGRRDTPDACWQAALLALRLLGERQAFDDLSIDYCVTYEVSPPSWEPMPPCIRHGAADDGAATAPPAGGACANASSGVEGSTFALRGEILGRMVPELAALRGFAAERSDVVVDCRGLRRLDFVAAGELLNEVVALVGGGKTVLFVEPSAIVEALMIVMGIQELADIRRRKI